MMRVKAIAIVRRLVQPALLLWPLALAGCQPAVLDPQGATGMAEKQLLIDSMAIMLAIVIPTIVLILGFAWWFRASNGRAKYRPDFTYSGQIELVVWGVPLLTIMLLGGVTWVASHELDPAKPIVSNVKPLEVQVVSLDWKWLFIYPEQRVASVNQLVIPVGTPVHFSLTSASVMNSFFVPQLGTQIYTMSGMSSQLNLIADHPGTFPGLSSHYSGDGFSDMHFDTRSLPADDFARWVQGARGAGETLDRDAYVKLEWQSSKVKPYTYRDADPELFNKIVSHEIPAAEGPHDGFPSVNVSNRSEH